MSEIESVDQSIFHNYIHHIIDEIYPQLFEKINAITHVLIDNKNWIEVGLLLASVEHLNKGLDELYRKEKLVLFPCFLEIINKNKSTPFNAIEWLHTSHKDILKQIKMIKELVYRTMIDVQDSDRIFSELNKNINEFEDIFIYMQVTVDERLIKKM